jgi:acetylcholinesterase
MLFQAQRRFYSQATSASYAYIFTDRRSDPSALGGFHGSDIPYLFGDLAESGPPTTARLSRMMLDYWISFAVSLTPNDGKGTTRMLSAVPSPALSLILASRTSLEDVQ